jgi:hypothetical protein
MKSIEGLVPGWISLLKVPSESSPEDPSQLMMVLGFRQHFLLLLKRQSPLAA